MIDTRAFAKVIETHQVNSESDVMGVVMAVYTIAQQLGYSAPIVSELATSVSELATNIVKYAGEGEVSIHHVETSLNIGLKVIASDSGDGISDLTNALKDNYSTGQSLGLGLPGVVRMMDDFDIQSSPEQGTVVTITKWKS